MKVIKRVLALSLIIMVIMQLLSTGVVFAEDYFPPSAPEQVQVSPLYADKPAIGYNEFDGNYVDLKWNPVVFGVGKTGYYNIYIQEVNKYGAPVSSPIPVERDLPEGIASKRIKNLKSGTIYYIYVKAYYRYVSGNSIYSSSESVQSNTVRALTDIKINAYSYGPNQIKIEWDDVWNVGSKRLDYKLYVSDNSSFNNTQPIFIGKSQIEPYGPVKVNQASGKLEYIHTVRDPGRVYYVKIAPDTTEIELKRNAETQTVIISSYILAKTSKMATTDFGTIWRLDWSPVVTGLNDTDINISYLIYRGKTDSSTLPEYMATVEETSFFVTIPLGQDDYYFTIKASVTRSGKDVYPVKIESDKIFVKDQEIPSVPPVPELADMFKNSSGDIVISFDDVYENENLINKGELKSDTATILWNAPKKGDGQVDEDVVYDIWIITDPNMIDNPPENTKIVSNLKMNNSENLVLDGTKLLGYKYKISNLTPNSTYYFKMVAKKSYIEQVDGILESVTYASQPVLKIIITPAEGPIDQPLVPARPPLKIKKLPPPSDKHMITENSVTIQLKNKWYERFDTDTGRWEYVRTEKDSENDIPDYIPDDLTLDNEHYRKVEYDEGVTVNVGCIKYTEGMSYEQLYTIPADVVTSFPVTANDPYEDPTLNPDGEKHNVDITLNGLESNTQYVIWVRVERKSKNLVSDPSDPIVFTTNPYIQTPVEKPVIPAFNYNLPGDNFIDLGWDVKAGYNYYIKYGTQDNLNAATGSLSTSSQELSYVSYYRINSLKQNTIYYFWIQAESVNEEGEKNQSAWSDSYCVKTLPDIAPATPTGFGVKNIENSVTKNSIIFEWLQEDGLEYILELSDDMDYKNAIEYKPGKLSEYKVEGLRSNYRYYARLYAYDPVRKLKSKPTQSITVRTERSKDDYDSDKDIENIVSGDFIVKGPVSNYIWTIKIVGTNADRFIEHVQKDKVMDYIIDLSKPATKVDKVVVQISSNVFKALSDLRENLIIATQWNNVVIRPDVLKTELDKSLANKLGDFNYEFCISSLKQVPGTKISNIKLKTEASTIRINAMDGGNVLPVDILNRPLKVIYSYTQQDWFNEGVTSGVVYDTESGIWNKASTSACYDADTGKGYVTFETVRTGDMAVADQGMDFYDDIKWHRDRQSINNVAYIHHLKSIPGRIFNPGAVATIGDTVKFMFDVLDYDYGSDYMTAAVKSGIINTTDAGRGNSDCTREKAISMVVRAYEIKTEQTAVAEYSNVGVYTDINKVTSSILPRIKFAVENGMVVERWGDQLNPQNAITRSEVMILLEKMLALAGEIE